MAPIDIDMTDTNSEDAIRTEMLWDSKTENYISYVCDWLNLALVGLKKEIYIYKILDKFVKSAVLIVSFSNSFLIEINNNLILTTFLHLLPAFLIGVAEIFNFNNNISKLDMNIQAIIKLQIKIHVDMSKHKRYREAADVYIKAIEYDIGSLIKNGVDETYHIKLN